MTRNLFLRARIPAFAVIAAFTFAAASVGGRSRAGDYPFYPPEAALGGSPNNNAPAPPEMVVRAGAAAVRSIDGDGFSEQGGGGVGVPPAWAAAPIEPATAARLLPFGVNLFQGNFNHYHPYSLSPSYAIVPGDQISVKIWGTLNVDTTIVVDHQGNIFIPQLTNLGPVSLDGVRHGELQEKLKRKILESYPQGLDVYATLLTSQPLSVYVAGFVARPGRYSGNTADSILSFVDRAGGIVNERGSYRRVRVMRGREEVAAVDFYEFMREGLLPETRLEANDVIHVEERGPSVAVLGLVRQQARYEHAPPAVRAEGQRSFSGVFTGRELMDMASPMENATHAVVSGAREGRPFNAYATRAEFADFTLRDNDVVEFIADRPAGDIMVSVSGAVTGDTRFSLKNGTTLRGLLAHVAVEPATADLDGIYLRRRRVAEEQRRSLLDALDRLEKLALTATSSSPAEAALRASESGMVVNFVTRARAAVKPDGVVVVCRGNQLADIMLEDGDHIVVPQKSQVVHVSGEVQAPKVVAHMSGLTARQAVASAGGFTRRADQRNLLIVRTNGEIENLGGARQLRAALNPGDHLVILPRYESKNLLLVKDMSQILYQMAIATKVLLDSGS